MNVTVTTFGCAEYLRRLGINPEGELIFIDATPRRIMVDEIKRAVCERFDVPLREMTSSRRFRGVARPRQVAMYLSHKLTQRTLTEIGRLFGHRDHTTVIHAIKQVEHLRLVDGEFAADVLALEERLS